VVEKKIIAKEILESIRFRPQDHKPIYDRDEDKLTDLIFIFMIFGFAIWFYFIVRTWYSNTYVDFFHLRNTQPNWLTELLGIPKGEEVHTEGYNDFNYYYVPYVKNFIDGWNPFTGDRGTGEPLGGYVYGPLYIFFISIGSLWFNMEYIDSIVYSNIVFTALSSVMVYCIALRVTGNVFAFIIGNIHTLSPVVLWFIGIKGLNAPPMTFFTLLFILCYLKHRDGWAIFFLATAFLVKQFPLLYAMPILMLIVRRRGYLIGFAHFVMLFFWIFLLSFPYIVMTPSQYLNSMLRGGRVSSDIRDADTAMAQQGVAPNLIFSTFLDDEVWFTQTIEFLFTSQLLFYLSLIILSIAAFSSYRMMEERPILYLRFFAAYQYIAHATIARGIYKYYIAFLIPFLLLALIPDLKRGSLNLKLGTMLNSVYKEIKKLNNLSDLKNSNLSILLIITTVVLGSISAIYYWTSALFIPSLTWRFIVVGLFMIVSIYLIYKQDAIIEEDNIEFDKLMNSGEIELRKSLLIQIIIITLTIIFIISCFLFLFTKFNYDPQILPFTLAATLITGLIAIPTLIEFMQTEEDKLQKGQEYTFLGILIAFILLFRFIIAPPSKFAEIYNISNSTNLSLLVLSTINSLFVASAIAGIYLFFDKRFTKITTRSRDLNSITNHDLNVILRILKQIFLLSMIFSFISVVERLSHFYYENSPEKFVSFGLLLMVTLISLFMLPIAYENHAQKSIKGSFYKFEVMTVMSTIIVLTFTMFIFWQVNVYTLLVHRLTNPSATLAIGIFLCGLLGTNFWASPYYFLKRAYLEFVEKINA
jgi:hypothetical protein